MLRFVVAFALVHAAQEGEVAPAKPAPAPAAPAAPAAAVQNLVVVTLDTVRADHLSCYGYFRDTTPNLDALAAESLRFTNCRTPIAQTTPSHTSLFTGVGPYEHGLLSNHEHTAGGTRGGGARLESSATLQTLAERCKARGMKTGGFVGATPVKKHTGLDAGFESWSEPERIRRPAAEVVRDAVKFMNGCGEAPFFVWAHVFDVHEPVRPQFVPQRFIGRYADDARIVEWLDRLGFPEKTDDLEERDLSVLDVNNRYDGALRFLDEQLAQLWARLRKPDLLGKTAIVVVADHGTANGQHAHMGHGICWDEQLRVPLLIHVPREKREPGVVDTPMSMLDIWPTLFALVPELADADFLRQCRGADVLAKDFDARPIVSISAREPRLESVTHGRWKLVRDSKGVITIYDHETDPNELKDVAADNAEIAKKLLPFLDAEIDRQQRARKLHAQAGADIGKELDPKILEELKALGYVDGE